MNRRGFLALGRRRSRLAARGGRRSCASRAGRHPVWRESSGHFQWPARWHVVRAEIVQTWCSDAVADDAAWYSGSGEGMRYMFPLAEEFGVIVIAPESRDLTWGQSAPGFDPDVRYLSAAVRQVVETLDIDPTHVALGGISDGAGTRCRWDWPTEIHSIT